MACRVINCVIGSSPRMRGARAGVLPGSVSRGIIPADAGSTWCVTTAIRTRRDHPRGCGEHDGLFHLTLSRMGSSPRMRGAHMYGYSCDERKGIIPADAGSTFL